MFATYIQKIVQNMICATGVYSREIISMFLVDQVSGLVENFNVGILADIV